MTELTDIDNYNQGGGGGGDPFCTTNTDTGNAYPAVTPGTSADPASPIPGTSGEQERKRKKAPPEARYWTWGSTQASTAAVLCCPLLAAFGIWYSVKAYRLFQHGEYNKSWKLKKVAWSFAVAALLCGIVIWLTIIAVFWSY